MKTGTFRLFLAAALILLPVFAAVSAHAFDEAAEEKAVKALFEVDLARAFTELDIERILGHYTDTALILTHGMGRGDKDRFRLSLERDFGRLKRIDEPSWQLESLSFDNEIAAAKVRIRERAISRQDEEFNRHATFYYRLMKVDGSWRIFLQSYRKDFELEPTGGFHRRAPHGRDPSFQ